MSLFRRLAGFAGIILPMVTVAVTPHDLPPPPAPRPIEDVACTAFPMGRSFSLSHPSEIVALELSPDGKLLFSASRDRTIQMVNPETGNPVGPSLAVGGPINLAVFSPNGKSIAVASGKNVQVFGLPSGKATNFGFPAEVTGLSFHSPDGKLFVAGLANGKIGVATLPDRVNKIIPIAALGGSAVQTVEVSHNGRQVLVTGADHQVVLIDIPTGKMLHQVESGTGKAIARFSPDGKSVAVTFADQQEGYTTKLLATKDFTPFVTYSHRSAVKDLDFSPDGTKLAMALGGTVLVAATDPASAKEDQRHLDHKSNAVTRIRFSADGKRLASLAGGAFVWSADGKPLFSAALNSPAVRVAVGSEGGRLAVASENHSITVMETKTVCSRKPVAVADLTPADAVKARAVFADLCKDKYDAHDWAAKMPATTPARLTASEAMAYLIRFQKPGGFDPQPDLDVLLGILDSDVKKIEPGLVLGALETVLQTSSALYEAVIHRDPSLAELSSGAIQNPPFCRTVWEHKAIEGSVRQYLADSIPRSGQYRAGWGASLAGLKRILSAMGRGERDLRSRQIADGFYLGARQSKDLGGLPLPLLRKYADHAAAAIFGSAEKSITEATSELTEDGVRAIAVGSDSLGADTRRNDYGFFSKPLFEALVPFDAKEGSFTQGVPNHVEWTTAGKTHTRAVEIEVGRTADGRPPSRTNRPKITVGFVKLD